MLAKEDASDFPTLSPTSSSSSTSLIRSLCCGAIAGLAVDMSLFPVDTIKTRLQSLAGFRGAGGFQHLYAGMSSVAIGSAPGAALFFASYSTLKKAVDFENPLIDAISASCAESIACIVRVPTEIVKQRAQAAPGCRIVDIVGRLHREFGYGGFYRGYLSTVSSPTVMANCIFGISRNPICFCRIPAMGGAETTIGQSESAEDAPVSPLESAGCGSCAGAIAAAVTTPLDVTKTRIMLSNDRRPGTIGKTLIGIYRLGGIRKLYSGIIPRTIWMSAGGFIFFGAYETAMVLAKKVGQ